MKNRKREKIIFLFFIIFIFFFTASFQNFRSNKEKKHRSHFFRNEIKSINKGFPFHSRINRYAPDQILVKFKASLGTQAVEAFIAAYQTKKIKRIPRINVYQLQIPKNVTVEEMLFILKQNPDVEYAEPNYKVHISVTPNDKYFRDQYSLFNSGQDIYWIPGSPQGKERADIKATEAWEETIGDEEILIAVIDTGVDLNHPDIKNKIFSSGRDFVNNDFDATDDNGHGTHVAGIAAAETNNRIGIAGVAWNCKILPVKVLDKIGEGYIDDVSDGIIWAVDKGANVINMSFGGIVNFGEGTVPKTLQNSLKDAYEKDVILVAAAGNDGGPVNWPASSEYCLAVAATNYTDERVTFLNSGELWESNYGSEIDVAAPGEWIISLWPEELTPVGFDSYAWAPGTSMSTAHVSGLAALIKSIKPWLKASEIMNVIRYSADDVNSADYPGKDEFIGYGRINMEKALVPIKITNKK